MIPKLSSQELNDVMVKAQGAINEFNSQVKTLKQDASKKLEIIHYETQYAFTRMQEIENGNFVQEPNMPILVNSKDGEFSKYGNTVHAKFIKEPLNVFNLNISGLGESYFRGDVKVLVNDVEKEEYLSILKHDSLPKTPFFDTFKDSKVKITVELNNLSNLLGPTRFNVIEFDSFLPGSYVIEHLNIYKFTEKGEIDEQDSSNILTITLNKVGKTRFVLPEKVNMYKVEFHIRVKENAETTNNGAKVFPLGIKHIYFYDADFVKDSYIVAEIKADNNIAIVKDKIKVLTPLGEKVSTIPLEGIELYLDYENGALSFRIEPSTPDNRTEIARGTKKVYAKIPLNSLKSLIAIGFNIEERNY